MIKTHTVHKYQRILWGQKRTPIFRCVLPSCRHYVHPEFVIGRECICHRCGDLFIIDRRASELKKPHCLRCTKGFKKSPQIEGQERAEDISTADVESRLDQLLKLTD